MLIGASTSAATPDRGQDGYRWNGVKTLILTTTGRRGSAACQPGPPRRFPPSPGRTRWAEAIAAFTL
jgi:hypothetical protein